MGKYEVTVFTGDLIFAGTWNRVYIKLVGTEGMSERTHLWKLAFYRGEKSQFTVSCPTSLGDLVVIELDKQCYVQDDAWYPAKVEVTSPEDKTYHFPIYHWITDSKVHHFREGTAKIRDDSPLPDGYTRQQELEQQRKVYCWDIYKDGIPHCIKGTEASLPDDVCFPITKKIENVYNITTGLGELELMKLAEFKSKFTCMDDISHLFFLHRTPIDRPGSAGDSDRLPGEYVRQHWEDDAFFGYQYLNGVNPLMIRRCTALPENLPVTDQMVFPHGQSTLTDEMKKGNIFLCDYKLLDGVETNTINGNKQYLAAPLVLLWKTNNDELTPIAIQLKQKPAEDNPIFVPTDSKDDWSLAKIFVRSADFNLYELNSHLLRTHLLAEVFTMSLLRNLPMVHPLYKLLIPHTRYTLQINSLAREKLISENGVFTQFAASGGQGAVTILKRSLDSLTYSSLCIPDDIAERGLKAVPNFYYRDDGLELWVIIHSFVSAVLSHYYKSDDEVQQDSELQTWIHDIYEHGFLSKESTGIPQKFSTVDEMVKFVTMVIFTGSAQHSAVNSGQYDFGGWMPNYPTSLELPPPTKKGEASDKTILNTLPDISTTIHGIATVWLLSRPSADCVLLGRYPNEHFTEEFPLQKIQEFQDALSKLSADINHRNKNLKPPYPYLDPGVIENSVSI